MTGKNPTDAGSFPLLEIGSITVDEQGTTIQWGSVPGKRYQVWSKPDAVPGQVAQNRRLGDSQPIIHIFQRPKRAGGVSILPRTGVALAEKPF